MKQDAFRSTALCYRLAEKVVRAKKMRTAAPAAEKQSKLCPEIQRSLDLGRGTWILGNQAWLLTSKPQENKYVGFERQSLLKGYSSHMH